MFMIRGNLRYYSEICNYLSYPLILVSGIWLLEIGVHSHSRNIYCYDKTDHPKELP